jgi:homogentisate phytyltransferase / homogentisate geranylgeranyltransferase
MFNKVKILWQFSRPHTIIGSVFSITALYCIACAGKNIEQHIGLYVATLFAALGCNVFIVGLNQIVDIKLDEINKPYLPLAAKTLSLKNAFVIIYVSLAIALIVSLLISLFLFLLITIILIIGVAYSVPPLQLKKHHLPAALAITIVRGFLVNVGMFLHFQNQINKGFTIPTYVWCLTIFIMAFSVAIAWFKDLPDTDGDNQYHIKTLAVLYSKKVALYGGFCLVVAAYFFMLAWCYTTTQFNTNFLGIAHIVLLALFFLNLFFLKLKNKASIKKFYLRFWVFFFAEYVVFTVWLFL